MCLIANEVEERASYLNSTFNAMVTDAQDALDDSRANPRRIVNILHRHDAHFTYVPHDFFDSLTAAADILDLFYKLDKYWDHFNYHLLERLILQPSTERLFAHNFKGVYHNLKDRMIAYKKEMEYFRKHTLIKVYLDAVPHPKPKDVPADFKELIKKREFETLQDVEEFRQEVAYEYKMCDFLVFMKKIEAGSVIITLWIPKCAVLSELEVFDNEDGSSVDPISIMDGVQVHM